jgi:hypothetical protein
MAKGVHHNQPLAVFIDIKSDWILARFVRVDRRHLGTQPAQVPAIIVQVESDKSIVSFQQGSDRWCIKSRVKEEKRNWSGQAPPSTTWHCLWLIDVHGFFGKDARLKKSTTQICTRKERVILDGKLKDLLVYINQEQEISQRTKMLARTHIPASWRHHINQRQSASAIRTARTPRSGQLREKNILTTHPAAQIIWKKNFDYIVFNNVNCDLLCSEARRRALA